MSQSIDRFLFERRESWKAINEFISTGAHSIFNLSILLFVALELDSRYS
jgi:hypothetical protein